MISEVNFPEDFSVDCFSESLRSGIAFLKGKKITKKSTELFTEFLTVFLSSFPPGFFTEFSTGFFTKFFTGLVPCPFRHPPSNMD